MVNDLRSILRVAQGKQGQPTVAIFDGRTLQSTCESRPRASYDGYKRKKGSKVHMAVDTLGHLRPPRSGQPTSRSVRRCAHWRRKCNM